MKALKALKSLKFLLTAFLLTTLAITPILHVYSSALTLTVLTTKPSYMVGENITVYGNLTDNDVPVPDWPVAIEVQDLHGTPVVTRSVQTNASGTYALTFGISASAVQGTYTVYVSSGYKGETATNSTSFYFKVPVRNINTQIGYATIQAAVDAAETLAGHTIFVGSGTYGRLTINKNNLTLIGENSNSTIIDGGHTGGHVVTVTANSTYICNFTVQNSAPVAIYAGIHLESSTGNTIANNIMVNDWTGIDLYLSSNSTLANNSIVCNNLNAHGIQFLHSHDNVVIDTKISVSGTQSCAIFISNSNSTSIARCSGRASGDSSLGIYLYGSSNNVTTSSLTGKDRGISLFGSNNTIVGNNITDSNCGVWLLNSSGNVFYHNNFINNTLQVYDYSWEHPANPSINAWDDDYPSGGNFWSDGNSTDLSCGPYQNETGSDGIGDTPYVIDGDNQDSYPLMKIYPWGSHDIGITSVTPSKTVVGQGFTLDISVGMFNYGDDTETFNVTVYCNETCMTLPNGKNFTTITLSSGNSTTTAVTWNTTGFAFGNYTLSAYAWPVEGETNTADNLLGGGQVLVSIPGDVNGDFTIDIYDAIILAGVFNSNVGNSNWKPNADLNGDGTVDIYDAIILAGHFNQHYP